MNVFVQLKKLRMKFFFYNLDLTLNNIALKRNVCKKIFVLVLSTYFILSVFTLNAVLLNQIIVVVLVFKFFSLDFSACLLFVLLPSFFVSFFIPALFLFVY